MRQSMCIRALSLIVLVCLGLVAPLALTTPRVQAQVLYGSIVGNVRDQSLAAIPGADITVIHEQTNHMRQTVSDEVGAYSFPTIAAGTYTVKVSVPGFKEFVKTAVPVTINNISRVDVRMELGEVTESLTVTSEATLLQTDRAEVRREIATKALQDLPVPIGRNYQLLFASLPGFTTPTDEHSIPTNPSRATAFNVNGATRSSNDIRIDGAGQYDIWLPHITAYIPSLEAIQTVNVVTNSFDAEQGLAGGAAINVQIKSGTNEFQGSAFEYNGNNGIMAKPFFLPPGQRNPKYIVNQFGGTFGGPIKPEKVFFFTSYEGTYERRFASSLGTIPDMAMRTGDLRGAGRPIYDPLTGKPDGTGRVAFTNNQIPANRIDPIAKKIIDLMPAPTFAGSLTNNYFSTGRYRFDRDTLDAKIDWRPVDPFNMYGRFSLLRYSMDAPTFFGDKLGGRELHGGNPGHGWGGTYGLTLAGTYVFHPTLVVDANFGYTRKDTSVEQSGLGENLGRDFLGLPGTNGTRHFESGWPRIQISGFEVIGIPHNFMPYYRRDPQRQVAANVNWTKSKHNIRFGGEVVTQHMNHLQPQFALAHPAQGGFIFDPGVTALPRASTNNYNSFAAFLLGLPRRMGRILLVGDEYSTRARFYGLYVRDQWNVTPNLTFSLGTRWEYLPFPTRSDRGLERYDFANNQMLVCGVGVVPTDCGVKLSKTLFAPRIGLAYRATSTFVIRAGYGISNDPFSLARPHRTNHPMLVALEISTPNTWTPLDNWRTGIPPIPVPGVGNGIIDIPPNVGVQSVGPEFDRGYIQSWNLTLQKRFSGDFVGEVGYVATRSIRLPAYQDLNAGQIPGAGRAGQPYFQRFGRTARTALFSPLGHTTYDSLQASLERRFAQGFQINANYSFSKNLGLAGADDQHDGAPRIRALHLLYLNRAYTRIHTPHRFNLSTIFEFPFGKGKRWAREGIGAAVLAGWQLNAVLYAHSGSPFSVTASGTSLNMPGNDQRADAVKSSVKKLKGVGRGQPWFDPFAFAPVTEPRFGTVAFNSILGPKQCNLDVGVFRTFQIDEDVTLQFRAEAFNFTNTPHLGNPGGNVSNMILNRDGTIQSLNGYSEITGIRNVGREGIDQRIFRFGLRVGF